MPFGFTRTSSGILYNMTCEAALMLVLDQVDYVRGNCSPTEMVAAVLPKVVIEKAREALQNQRLKKEKI